MSTTVRELITALQAFPDDALVVISKDGEGNSFSPAADIQGGLYEPESTWAGEFDGASTTMNAVCIWPVN